MIRFSEGFLGRLNCFEDLEGMEGLLKETLNGLGMGHLYWLDCSDSDFAAEVAWNFGYRHVLDFSGPEDFEVSAGTKMWRPYVLGKMYTFTEFWVGGAMVNSIGKVSKCF